LMGCGLNKFVAMPSEAVMTDTFTGTTAHSDPSPTQHSVHCMLSLKHTQTSALIQSGIVAHHKDCIRQHDAVPNCGWGCSSNCLRFIYPHEGGQNSQHRTYQQ
jgi:hypothetical protein